MSGETEQDSAAAVKSSATRRAPHHVIDGFLENDMADEILAYLLEQEDQFTTGGILDREGGLFVDDSIRSAYKLPFERFALADHYAEKLTQALPLISKACGVEPLASPIIDIDAAAYRDGGLYTPHVDTLTHAARTNSTADRILSLIYYVNRQPSGFTGGELALYPIFGDGQPELIAPQHNRLVAFPSFVRHEVKPVSVPGDAFDDARFSINCWVLRPHN